MASIKPSTIQTLSKLRLLPVIALPDAALAEPMADALVESGLACAEITFRTDAAEAGIRQLAKRGDMFLAAGTVLSVEQAQRAVDAGARCLLSPGTDPTVIQWCQENSVDIIPGVATPTDMLLAKRMGLDVLKFFPAQSMGGPPALRAMSAPMPALRFIPTGGIAPDNLLSYLALPNVLACGGSWLVDRSMLAQKDFRAIREATAQAVKLIETNAPA